jgi:haloalkane dehalogenase
MTETILRTPESRFTGLPDYPFAPNYHQVTDALRLHYVDVGPRDAAPVLMLHGEPTWSYLYRHVINPVAAVGHRVLAPDLVGFGKSDKPSSREAYTFAGHVAWIRHWIEALDLREITLVCQDWGSLVGLRLAAESPERFARIIIQRRLPTAIPTPIVRYEGARAIRLWFPSEESFRGTRRPESGLSAYDSSSAAQGSGLFPLLNGIETLDRANRGAADVGGSLHLLQQRRPSPGIDRARAHPTGQPHTRRSRRLFHAGRRSMRS